jgi:hypothetical protein
MGMPAWALAEAIVTIALLGRRFKKGSAEYVIFTTPSMLTRTCSVKG